MWVRTSCSLSVGTKLLCFTSCSVLLSSVQNWKHLTLKCWWFEVEMLFQVVFWDEGLCLFVHFAVAILHISPSLWISHSYISRPRFSEISVGFWCCLKIWIRICPVQDAADQPGFQKISSVCRPLLDISNWNCRMEVLADFDIKELVN